MVQMNQLIYKIAFHTDNYVYLNAEAQNVLFKGCSPNLLRHLMARLILKRPLLNHRVGLCLKQPESSNLF